MIKFRNLEELGTFIKPITMDAYIAVVRDLQLAKFAEKHRLAYDRTSQFVLVGDHTTLDIKWNANMLYQHYTLEGVVKSFLSQVILTFSKSTEVPLLEYRQKLCKTCPLFDSSSTRCRSCGCYMNTKWTYQKSTCPLNKW